MTGRVAPYVAALVVVAALVTPASRRGPADFGDARTGVAGLILHSVAAPLPGPGRSLPAATLLPASVPNSVGAPLRAADRAFASDAHFGYIRSAQRPGGAIAITPGAEAINPYFANIAARALLLQPEQHRPVVERWLEWYVEHLNADGSVDDYRVRNGREVATGDYDSADSYAATFLSLVATYLETGGDQQWVRDNRSALDRIAGRIDSLTDGDGLVWAKPYYPLKLLMDNAEVFQGWIDWARALDRLGEAPAASAARLRADRIRESLDRFRLGDQTYAWGLAPLGLRRGGNLERFYPDAVVQFIPFTLGVTHDLSGWERFAAAYPDWHQLEQDRFPWMLAAHAARLAGDHAGAEAALATAAARFGHFRYPWYIAESAWALYLLEQQA